MDPTATPPFLPAEPARIRIEGVLVTVRASDQTFVLRQANGRELNGRLVRGAIAGLGGVLGRKLLVFGSARLTSSGELTGIEADGYIPNDDQPWTLLSPSDLPPSPDVVREMADRLKQAIGAWPGDETDEEIEKALRELS